MAAEPGTGQDERTETERLRARVDQLERELAERTARANAAVAAAQDRSYWIDRLRLDLDAIMRRRWARALWTATRLAAAFAAHVRGGPESLRKLPERAQAILAEERESARR